MTLKLISSCALLFPLLLFLLPVCFAHKHFQYDYNPDTDYLHQMYQAQQQHPKPEDYHRSISKIPPGAAVVAATKVKPSKVEASGYIPEQSVASRIVQTKVHSHRLFPPSYYHDGHGRHHSNSFIGSIHDNFYPTPPTESWKMVSGIGYDLHTEAIRHDGSHRYSKPRLLKSPKIPKPKPIKYQDYEGYFHYIEPTSGAKLNSRSRWLAQIPTMLRPKVNVHNYLKERKHYKQQLRGSEPKEVAVAFVVPPHRGSMVRNFQHRIKRLQNSQVFADRMEEHANPSVINLGYKAWNWVKGYSESPAPVFAKNVNPSKATFNHPFGSRSSTSTSTKYNVPPVAFYSQWLQQDRDIRDSKTKHHSSLDDILDETPKCTKGSTLIFCNSEALKDFLHLLEENVKLKLDSDSKKNNKASGGRNRDRSRKPKIEVMPLHSDEDNWSGSEEYDNEHPVEILVLVTKNGIYNGGGSSEGGKGSSSSSSKRRPKNNDDDDRQGKRHSMRLEKLLQSVKNRVMEWKSGKSFRSSSSKRPEKNRPMKDNDNNSNIEEDPNPGSREKDKQSYRNELHDFGITLKDLKIKQKRKNRNKEDDSEEKARENIRKAIAQLMNRQGLESKKREIYDTKNGGVKKTWGLRDIRVVGDPPRGGFQNFNGDNHPAGVTDANFQKRYGHSVDYPESIYRNEQSGNSNLNFNRRFPQPPGAEFLKRRFKEPAVGGDVRQQIRQRMLRYLNQFNLRHFIKNKRQ